MSSEKFNKIDDEINVDEIFGKIQNTQNDNLDTDKEIKISSDTSNDYSTKVKTLKLMKANASEIRFNQSESFISRYKYWILGIILLFIALVLVFTYIYSNPSVKSGMNTTDSLETPTNEIVEYNSGITNNGLPLAYQDVLAELNNLWFNPGCCLIDLDNNGVSELIIGDIQSPEKVYAFYTLSENGEAIKVGQLNNPDEWFGISPQNEIIYTVGESINATYVYQLNGSEVQFLRSYQYDYTDDTYYSSTDRQNLKETEITLDEYLAGTTGVFLDLVNVAQ